MTISVGIDRMAYYTPHYYIDMVDFAHARQVDPNKFLVGLQQEQMAVIPIWEDIITMGANAASKIITDEDRQLIDYIIFATESSFDYSKAAGTHIHELLGIQPNVKTVEMKQACYAASAGLMSACDYVQIRPNSRVLLIASDVAKYGLNTPGEATQGAGAVAMIIQTQPRIMSIATESYCHTDNQYDFWRPNYSAHSMVDGHFSNECYLNHFLHDFNQLELNEPEKIRSIQAILFHLPYTKMGRKALLELGEMDTIMDEKFKATQITKWLNEWESSTQLGKRIGNVYTASLYLALISYLLNRGSLSENTELALFSYGSGTVSELFFGQLQANYHEMIQLHNAFDDLNQREKLTVSEYEKIFQEELPIEDDKYLSVPASYKGYYLEQINGHRRFYAKN